MQCGVVTTCGVTSIRQSPGDPRVPVSQCRLQVRLLSRLVVVLSAVLQDEAMAGLLAKCGATNSFTLVRYSPPQLLASYSRSPPQVAYEILPSCLWSYLGYGRSARAGRRRPRRSCWGCSGRGSGSTRGRTGSGSSPLIQGVVLTNCLV